MASPLAHKKAEHFWYAPVPTREGEADPLCIPASGGLCPQVQRRPARGTLRVRQDGCAIWAGQDVDFAECVRSYQKCQYTKVEHGGPHGLRVFHPLQLLFRSVGMIVEFAVDPIAGLQTTAVGFDS